MIWPKRKIERKLDVTFKNSKWFNLLFSLVIISALILLDVIRDVMSTTSLSLIYSDIILEMLILSFTFYSLFNIWSKLQAEQLAKSRLELELDLTKIKAINFEKISQNFIDEFQKNVVEQFNQWDLSKSEQEIAWMILKGLCAKEMANDRNTSERTIRNQCLSIYQKSQCQGRNELWSYFFSKFIPKDLTSVQKI